MRHIRPAVALILSLVAAWPPRVALAQDTQASEGRRPAREVPLFASHDQLVLNLTTDLRTVLRDRGESAPWRPASLMHRSSESDIVVPVRVRTRGIFRLKNCGFPPIRFNFVKDSVRGTVFERQDRPKLVTHCQNNNSYEQYVLSEYIVYRVLGALTPLSIRARLAKVTYIDANGRSNPVTRAAIILEEPAEMAARNGGERMTVQGVTQEEIDPTTAIQVALFQYMMGNVDWSVPALHNIELVKGGDGRIHAVPYDFDYSGAVQPRYARPNPLINQRHVTERMWRGVCPPEPDLVAAIALFNEKRPEIEAIIGGVPGIEPRNAERLRKYFDEFYRTLNDRRALDREIAKVCNPRGR
ncbi:MAG TPA: hypothetical protein VMM18_15905 [Gemmatimonadaceae bacterium]|nr:hypothetical protein [Gemmatimonadaceae bacterium]